MTFPFRQLAWGCIFLVLVCPTGCSRGPRAKRPQTYPVRGTVTFDGKPLEQATVMFNPVAAGNGAIAVTNRSGEYALTTFVPDDGAVPGEYKVAITKVVLGNASESPMAVPPDPKNVLAPRYGNSDTSGFRATVEAKPDNTFDFSLEK